MLGKSKELVRQDAERLSSYFSNRMEDFNTKIAELIDDAKLEEVENFEKNYIAATSVDAILTDNGKSLINYFTSKFNQDIATIVAVIKTKFDSEKADELWLFVIGMKGWIVRNLLPYEGCADILYELLLSGDLKKIAGLLSGLEHIHYPFDAVFDNGEKTAIECYSKLEVGHLLVDIAAVANPQKAYFELIRKRGKTITNSEALIARVKEKMKQENMNEHLLQLYSNCITLENMHLSDASNKEFSRLLELTRKVLLDVLLDVSNEDFTINAQAFTSPNQIFSIPQIVCTAEQRKQFKRFLEQEAESRFGRKVSYARGILHDYNCTLKESKQSEVPLKEKMDAKPASPVVASPIPTITLGETVARAKRETTTRAKKVIVDSRNLNELLLQVYSNCTILQDMYLKGGNVFAYMFTAKALIEVLCAKSNKDFNIDALPFPVPIEELSIPQIVCTAEQRKAFKQFLEREELEMTGVQKICVTEILDNYRQLLADKPGLDPAFAKSTQIELLLKDAVETNCTQPTVASSVSVTSMHRFDPNSSPASTSSTASSTPSKVASSTASESSSASTPATPPARVMPPLPG